MKSKSILFYTSFLLLVFNVIIAQKTVSNEQLKQKFTLSGTISDSKTNESLIGVNIFIPELKAGITTNEYGFYSITIPKGNYTIQISYVGYQNITEKLLLDKSKKIDFSLTQDGQQLEEVIVTSDKKATNIRKPEMSVNRLSGSAIKKIPVVLGEVDVLKALLTLPGVTNAGEGQSGFNVRGGGADQNLILLDEATIFNSSHVFGFFSVFNPDVVKDLKLYKGGIPARFGGRASSVLDIYQKDGNSNKFGVSGGIGL
ncbi:carboxypeptidase-like regulatory domain-containing protein, partial [Flavobacterium sp.]|uniref:TonB-dependent receptor n=1 Tax=Flavobacterium sp. TaxID=239 RepID=UPI0038FC772F